MAQAGVVHGGRCQRCFKIVGNFFLHLLQEHPVEEAPGATAERSQRDATAERSQPFKCELCNKTIKGHHLRHYQQFHHGQWPKRRNPSKTSEGRKKRYLMKCPVEGCNDAVVKLRQHLRKAKKHAILTEDEINNYCAMPKSYTGELPKRKPADNTKN